MKRQLLARGAELASRFCEQNNMPVPPIFVRNRADWPFDVCAYYRPTKIEICLDKCAAIGVAGRQWSFPGYSVDRTPYGVIQHELGHHVDVLEGGGSARSYMSNFSRSLRAISKEAPLTGYCPNDGEWFAEMFRLFVTNPDLLSQFRPETHGLLSLYFKPVVNVAWWEVLREAPQRTIDACTRKGAR